MLRLDIDALVDAVPAGDAAWAMRLRQHPRPRIGWLAAWRRRHRRRAGWRPARLSLCVANGRAELSLRGEPIASRRFADPAAARTSAPTTADEPSSIVDEAKIVTRP